MLSCVYCNNELPNTAGRRQTERMKKSAVCNPMCKIKNQIITIDPMGCWIHRTLAFTWGYRSFSVKGFIYCHEFGCSFAPEKIPMKCKSNNCANPDHMIVYGRPRLKHKERDL